jgi:tetratricopeptide (TPR) repeat protein
MTSGASTVLASAETALAAHDYELAIEVLVDGVAELRGDPRAELRAHLDESWARMSIGDLDEAIVKLERARALAEAAVCDDTDRAEVLYQLACCRLKAGSVSNAVQLLTVALRLAEQSPTLSDRLRVDILCWRTRCYRRQRDWDAARADAEAAIQLGEELHDSARLADAYLQASQIAERTGQLLIARFYVERVIELQREAGDLLSAGKALNNLCGILFLLGETDAANMRLKEAFAVALELGNEVDAAYAVSSTAQVLLRGGEPVEAEQKARYALELLENRDDHVNEIGNAKLVLGRALMEQGRFDESAAELAAADESFVQMDSLGHCAAAWLAQGDLAARRGHIEEAAAVYRRAAEALQDVRF